MLTRKIVKKVFIGLLDIFALIGIATVGGFLAIKLGWTNTKGIVDSQSRFLRASVTQTTAENPPWTNTPEWKTFTYAATADTPTINKAASQSGVSARLIVAQLVSEQLRLYNTDREVYKQIFQPLQILGVQSQFSWGVMGIKQETAIAIEQNLITPTSTWYLGSNYEHALDFKTADHNTERFNRLIDEHDYFYSYLYTGLYLKQIMTQWKNAGFDISARPEILSTLYNIGFSHSKPNANPNSGGAAIEVGGITYSFGDLAAQFYYSNELISEFPR
jgi:hypothetical protein